MMIAGTRWQEGVWRSSPLPRRSCAPCYPPCSRVMCPSLGFHSPFLHCASLTSTEAEAVPAASKEFSEQLQQAPPPPLSAEVSSSRYGGPLLQPISVSVPYGNRQITIETGLMGRQASGAVTVTDGETILYSTACAAEEVIEPSDFAPLSVHYQERFSAAGRTSGGFFKREGRAKDHEILICRLIDRPLRPMIVKGFYHDTQLLSWVFSYDSVHSPEPLAIVAASAALALSDIPVLKTVGAVRVGLIDGKYIVNPTVPEMKSSRLDMIVAGAGRSVIMIEGCGKFVSEEEMLEAISVGQEAVAKVCDGIEELASRAGKTKRLETIRLPSPTIYKYIEELAADELVKALQIASKSARKKAISLVESKVMDALTQSKDQSTQSMQSPPKEEEELLDFHEEVGLEDGLVDEGDLHVKPVLRKKLSEYFDPVDVKVAFKEVISKLMRRLIIKNRRRSDGRGPTEIRPIQCSCNLLPRAHGSALFTRGETQALAVTTLGGDDMGQRLDNLTEIETKRFYLQYSFSPSSVGETGRVGAPSRREIGHGVLAEKALECALPSEESFPYTIRLESTITESNGSSSMASVCGGSLALMDAGIPLKYPIAGVAMGLILNSTETGEDSEPVILSDIIGAEDALGDMDFKIAGSETGITAFQMDIKADGLDLKILEMALLQARDGRLHILGEMAKCEPPPAKKLSKYAPLIEVFKVEPDKINSVIGSGGRTVRSIIEQSGVDSIDLEDDGSVRILARSAKAMESAKSKILGLTVDPLVGTIYRDCEVKSIVSFGCFMEIAPGREGLCHISELCKERIEKVEDILKVGDKVDVKLIEVNLKGQVRLSRRALLGDAETETAAQEMSDATSDGQTKAQKQVPNSEKVSRASKDGQADATKQTRRTGRTSSASKDGQTEGKSKAYKTDIFIVPPRNGQTGAQKEALETEVQSSVSKDGGRVKEKMLARSVAMPAEKKSDSTEAVSADSTDVGVAERTAPVSADSTDVGVPQV